MNPDTAALIEEWRGSGKRKRVQREHVLQEACGKAIAECIDIPHKWLSVDRSRKQSRWQHASEKRRGLVKGTADCNLTILGRSIWTELKAKGKTPNSYQNDFGDDIIAAGGEWFWADSVTSYIKQLLDRGIPMRSNALLIAAHHDGRQPAPYVRPSRSRKVPK